LDTSANPDPSSFFETALRSLPEAILLLQGVPPVIVWCNKAAEQILGIPQSELIGQPISRYYSDESYLNFFKQQPDPAGKQNTILETHVVRPHVQTVEMIEHKIIPIVNPETDQPGWICYLSIPIQFTRPEPKYELRVKELKALNETMLEISSEMNLTSLLKSIVQRAANLVRVPIAGLYRANPEKQVLELAVSNYLPDDQVGIQIGFGKGLSGRVYQTGQPMQVEDYQTWEYREETFNSYSFRKMLAVPVKTSRGTWGVLNLCHDKVTGVFTQEEIHLISLFADQAAIAIEKTYLIEAEQKRNRDLARSNALIAALGNAASLLNLSLQPHEVIQTVGNELKQLGLTIQIMEYEPVTNNLIIRYSSIHTNVQKWIEKKLGIQLIGYSIPLHIQSVNMLVASKRVLFTTNPIPSLLQAFDWVSPASMIKFLEKMGVSEQTPVIHVPLLIKEQLLGIISIWGTELSENDVPAFRIFAAQVSTALENARLFNEIKQLATTDELTGILNRRGFFNLADHHLRIAQRKGFPIAFLFIDIDDFKLINDRYGHQEGDRALMVTADLFKHTFRTTDLVARMGGDEFAILAFDVPPNAMERMLERLMNNLDFLNQSGQLEYTLSLSIGVSTWLPDQPIEIDRIISEADHHMYTQKRKKKYNEFNLAAL